MKDRLEAARAEICRRIAAAGQVFNEDTIATFGPLYAELHEIQAKRPLKITCDIAYGPHPTRNLLDVHAPDGGPEQKRPIVIFFHGGGLVRGQKDGGGPYFGNIANFFAAHGAIGINATYRLAPEIQWPEGARDIGAAAAWARANASSIGGDPEKIILMGHSAGATHVAGYALRPELHPEGKPGFAGAILMSGVYGIDMDNPPPNHRAYYGEERSLYPSMQVIGNAGYCSFPMLVSFAQYDPLRFTSGAFRLLAELVEKGAQPQVRQLMGHNHISPAFAIGTGDTDIEAMLLDFVRRV